MCECEEFRIDSTVEVDSDGGGGGGALGVSLNKILFFFVTKSIRY